MKKLIVLLLALLCCFSIVSCNEDKIDPDSEVDSLEKEIELLEEAIGQKYGLDDFEIQRIRISILDKRRKPFRLTVEGTYEGDGERDFWEKRYTITPKDFNTLYSVNDDMLIYNVEEYDDQLEITFIPAWVIEGVYNIIIK